MARLNIEEYDGPTPKYDGRVQVRVTLSRRNLLSLLHKLDLAGSARRIENDYVFQYAQPSDDYILVLRVEDDEQHYEGRPVPPGVMHPETEAFIASH